VTGKRLPSSEHALVAERKVVDYLLSETHPDGRGKARFFSDHGFSISEWRTLAEALRRHVAEHPVVESGNRHSGYDTLSKVYSRRRTGGGPWSAPCGLWTGMVMYPHWLPPIP
jgi:hypothetical protein